MVELPFSLSFKIESRANLDPMCTKYNFDPNFLAIIPVLRMTFASDLGGRHFDQIFRPVLELNGSINSLFFFSSSEQTSGSSAWTSTTDPLVEASLIMSEII